MLFTEGVFGGFGPNPYDPRNRKPESVLVHGNSSATLRTGIREKAPKLAGVYGMLDPRGRLHYVGKAKCLRSRLMCYFRPASRDPKAGKIIAQSRSIVWEQSPGEFAALLRELQLIRRFCPPFNVIGQPGRKRFVYLCLGRSPAYIFRSRDIPIKADAVYGPLPGNRRLGDAVRRLNDMYRLRDCPNTTPMRFGDQRVLFPIIEPAGCLRYDIGTCMGPCIAAITRRDYRKQAQAAKAFLDGRDSNPVEQMQVEMKECAISQNYEKAAMLRDRIDDLTWLQERLAWLQHARREYSFVYPCDGVWYFIRGGRVLHATHAPNAAGSRKSARQALESVFPAGGGPSIIPNELYDHVLLVSGWFRRRPEELMKTLQPNAARRACASPAAA